jgi:hypothetical protein
MRMGKTKILIAAVSVAALGLAACEGGDNRRRNNVAAGGDGLCKPFTGTAQAATPGMGMDGGLAVDDCLHRWGYTLAKAEEDDAGSVAQAVVAACSAPLARWNQQSLANAAAMSGDRSLEAPSLLTGENTNPIAEHNSFAEGRALFYVVQARAGDCDAPRAGDGEDDRRDAQTAPAVQAPAYAPNSPDR